MVKLTFENTAAKLGKAVDPRALTSLTLTNAQIDDLGSFEKFKSLVDVDLSNNRICFQRQLTGLFGAKETIQTLNLSGNPVCSSANYRLFIIYNLPLLTTLDGAQVTDLERSNAEKVIGRGEAIAESSTSYIDPEEAAQLAEAAAKQRVDPNKRKEEEELRKKRLFEEETLEAQRIAALIAKQDLNPPTEVAELNSKPQNSIDEEKRQKEAEKAAKLEAEKRAKLEAQQKAKLEAEQKEAEKKAKSEAEKKAKLEAQQKAKLEAEQKEAEKKAKSEAEKKAKLEAQQKAKLEADQNAKLEAERKAKLEAEAKLKAQQEAQEKAAQEQAKNAQAASSKSKALSEEKQRIAQESYAEAESARHEKHGAKFQDSRTGLTITTTLTDGIQESIPSSHTEKKQPRKPTITEEELFGSKSYPDELDLTDVPLTKSVTADFGLSDDILNSASVAYEKKQAKAASKSLFQDDDDLFAQLGAPAKKEPKAATSGTDLFAMLESDNPLPKAKAPKKTGIDSDLFDIESYISSTKTSGGLFD